MTKEKTHNKLPVIGFGTGQLLGDVAQNATMAALRVGCRLIDTGAMYENEAQVGRAITQSGVPREEIVLITKGAHYENEHGYEQTLAAFDASLHRLGLSYVDYYLIHWPVNPLQRKETWRAMEEIQLSGKSKAIGVSNYAQHHLQELETMAVQPVVNEIEFHPYIFNEQKAVMDYCQSHGIYIIGYATYANGQGDHDPIVGKIAKHHGKTPRQVLTRWSMQHNLVPLVRSGNPDHIAANYAVDDFELARSEMALLDNLHGERQFRDPKDLP